MNVALIDIVACLNKFLQTENVISLQEARDLSRFYIADIGKAMRTINPKLLAELTRSNPSQNSLLFRLLHYLNERDVDYQKFIQLQFSEQCSEVKTTDETVDEKIEAAISRFQAREPNPVLDTSFISEDILNHLRQAVDGKNPELNTFCRELTVKLTNLQSRVDALTDTPDYTPDITRLENHAAENHNLLSQIIEGIRKTLESYQEGMTLLSSNVGHMLHNLLTKQVEFHQQLLASYRERLELQHTELRQQAFERGRLSALVEAQEILLQRQKRQIEDLRNETSEFTLPDKNQELITRLESMLQHFGNQQESMVSETLEKEAREKIEGIPGFTNLLKLSEPMEVEQDLWVTGARETVMDISENHIRNASQLESLFNFIFAMNLKFKKEANIQFERIRPSSIMVNEVTSEGLLHVYTAAITMLVSLDFELMSHLRNTEVAASVRARFVKLTTTFCLLFAFAEQSQKQQGRRLELEQELLQSRTKNIDSQNSYLIEKKSSKDTIDRLTKQLRICQSEKSLARDLYDKVVHSNDKQQAADLKTIGELRQQLKQLQEGAKFEGQSQLDQCTLDLLKLKEEIKKSSSENLELRAELDAAKEALNREIKNCTKLKKAFEESDMQVNQLNIWVETVEANEKRLKEHIADLNQHLDPSIARRMDDVCKTLTQNANQAVERLMANKRPIDDEADDGQRKRMRTQTT
ncbi:hypothetical protein HDE_06205 [Halotydeus destructor]|nr:hypothetical protein HDE_06205 [Halotydeus destructor]